MSGTIWFHHPSEPFGFLSNFALYPLQLSGKRWPSTEHYFQAQKFAGTAHEGEIRRARTPGIAARLGRERSKGLRRDWESVKDSVMRDAVYAKFTQHVELADWLLETGDALLVEHRYKDAYWADGGDGSGKNMLGRILMDVREELRRGRDLEGPLRNRAVHG